jgi:hypothetical protein
LKLRVPVMLVVIFVLILPSLHMPGTVHAQTYPDFSSVYLSPVSQTTSGASFKLNVLVNLTATDTMNSFDVRINYSLPVNLAATAETLNYSQNIFQGRPGIVLKWCVNSTPVNGSTCDNDDAYGQVHFSQALLGQMITGPVVAGLLFSLSLTVSGTPGTSILALDRADLVDPIDPDSSINPHLLNVLKLSAVFSNNGLVSFFNYWPTSSPALLPGEPVAFDARSSFNANNATDPIKKYSWFFDDGGPRQNVTSAINQHAFFSAGNYSVTLIVTDAQGQSSNPFGWTVSIVKPLGAIILVLRTSTSEPLLDPATVKIFNSTLTVKPFAQESSTSSVTFIGLVPGTYTLTVSGSTIENYSTTRSVSAGLSTQVTAYLVVHTPGPSYLLDIFYGALVVAVGVLAGAIVLKKYREKKKVKIRKSAVKKSKR